MIIFPLALQTRYVNSYSEYPGGLGVDLYMTVRRTFNGLFSHTASCVSRRQISQTSLDFNEAREEMTGWHWHQLDHMRIICTSLQTDNNAITYIITQCFTGWMLFLTPNQQCQSTEGK